MPRISPADAGEGALTDRDLDFVEALEAELA